MWHTCGEFGMPPAMLQQWMSASEWREYLLAREYNSTRQERLLGRIVYWLRQLFCAQTSSTTDFSIADCELRELRDEEIAALKKPPEMTMEEARFASSKLISMVGAVAPKAAVPPIKRLSEKEADAAWEKAWKEKQK